MQAGDVTRRHRGLDGRDPGPHELVRAAPPVALRPPDVGPRIVIGIG